MKLAQALADRKALADRVTALSNRARKSVVTVQGHQPSESVRDLLSQIDRTLEQWEQRVVQINRANQAILLADGMTLMEALARRDRLTRSLAIMNELIQAALGPQHERYAMVPREMSPVVPAVDLAVLQDQADRLSQERMQLDLAIQEAGWNHDIS